MSPSPRPELVTDGYHVRRRPRWAELATTADHKELGQILICGALGFLFIAAVELVLMRLQLLVPENTFLSPVGFNRMLSMYGATSIFLFALPFALGFFYYVAPLQVGARGTALPRLGQTGVALTSVSTSTPPSPSTNSPSLSSGASSSCPASSPSSRSRYNR